MTKYVTNKASSNDFNKYINILGNDNSFLKKFNQQLGILNKYIDTLSKLFDISLYEFTSFQSQKQTKKKQLRE